LVAYKLGTKVCVLTEGNDEVTTILKQNVDELKAAADADGSRVLDAAKHLWGEELDDFEQRFPYKYDVIMGSDIMYVVCASRLVPSSRAHAARECLTHAHTTYSFFDDALEGLMVTLDRLLLRTKEAVVFLAYSYASRSAPSATSSASLTRPRTHAHARTRTCATGRGARWASAS
jgi:hypothetical protein